VCARTILKGERTEYYLTPSRERRMVCQLCEPRAQREGWIREDAAPEAPARPQRPQDRRGILRWGRRRGAEDPPGETAVIAEEAAAPAADAGDRTGGRAAGDPGDEEESLRPQFRRRRPGPRSPRHVRAVPTNAELKIDRALDLFNGSEHRRTVAGIVRTLGPPSAGAMTSLESAAQVVVTVAWELSWYQFVVDLSDGREPVQVRTHGRELEELPEHARDWNLETLADGSLVRADAAVQETVETGGD
jgi:hypothetical protein